MKSLVGYGMKSTKHTIWVTHFIVDIAIYIYIHIIIEIETKQQENEFGKYQQTQNNQSIYTFHINNMSRPSTITRP